MEAANARQVLLPSKLIVILIYRSSHGPFALIASHRGGVRKECRFSFVAACKGSLSSLVPSIVQVHPRLSLCSRLEVREEEPLPNLEGETRLSIGASTRLMISRPAPSRLLLSYHTSHSFKRYHAIHFQHHRTPARFPSRPRLVQSRDCESRPGLLHIRE